MQSEIVEFVGNLCESVPATKMNARVEIEELDGPHGHVEGTRVSLTLQDHMYDSHHSG
jgi:hypothetical protein